KGLPPRGESAQPWDGKALRAEAVEAGLVDTSMRVSQNGTGANGCAVGQLVAVSHVEVPPPGSAEWSRLCESLATHIRSKYSPAVQASTAPATQVADEEPQAQPGLLSRTAAAVGKLITGDQGG